MKTNLSTILCLFFIVTLFAQQPIADELIVKLHPSVSPSDFEQSMTQQRNFSESIFEFKSIGPTWNLHNMVVDEKQADEIMIALNNHPDVAAVGFNFQLKERGLEPNDPQYNQQWDMEVINASEVWEFTTGGVTSTGDTIVIANLEYTDLDHEDFEDNIWINHNEIPGNFIDDDLNGYSDDYRGFNAEFNLGDFVDQAYLGEKNHGTLTSGIMAAKGNNLKGITGVNWDVKLMVVSSKLLFSDIVTSYQYILDMRTLYNNTDGEKGAFVVATNASFGTSGFPEDLPIYTEWCEMYDSLGAVGVLSVGATTNDGEDIAINGDLPTSCPSDYMIGVTNVNEANVQRGGYNQEHIDLGAPGSTVQSLEPFDGYGTIGGTSSAAPHVTSGIGLLYSVPCEKWMQLVKSDPAEAALVMKDFILNGVAPLTSLEGITATGGILDLKGSFDLIQNYCGSSTGPLEILNVRSNLEGQQISIDYQTPAPGVYTIRIYDLLGKKLGEKIIEPKPFEVKDFDIDVSTFSEGIYFLSIENNENIVSKPFVVYYEK